MPRRRRGLLDRTCYHITHRCHQREFLLKFEIDRNKYLEILFRTKQRYKVDFLDYMITSNHVHLLIWSRAGQEIPRALQYVQGQFAQYYNQRKKRQGAFWRDRYHTTIIQSGYHLSRCLFYIDLNMVRAGAVDHPEKWKHCGYQELINARKRYRIINQRRLLQCLQIGGDPVSFMDWYRRTLEEKVKSIYRVRESYWTEAYAIGDEKWLKGIYKAFGFKNKKILQQNHTTPEKSELYEEQSSYFIEG